MTIDELKILQEKIMTKDKKINKVVYPIMILVLLLTVYVFLKNNIKIQYIFVFVLCCLFFEFIVIIIAIFIKGKVNGEDIDTFNSEFKRVFVLKYLKNNFEDVIYNSNEGFKEEEIEKVGILNTGDSFESNDYISAKYKNIRFEQSDINIAEKHKKKDKDGNEEEVLETIFKGRWLVFDFNKQFKSNIQISSLGFSADSLPRGKTFSHIKMEDTEFNEMFIIYSESEHDAFYILTPHFMEKLKSIYKKLNCDVMFGFIDSRLYIAIDNRDDSFEYNIFEKIDEVEIEKNILNDIEVIRIFVDELDLDNSLFRREV